MGQTRTWPAEMSLISSVPYLPAPRLPEKRRRLLHQGNNKHRRYKPLTVPHATARVDNEGRDQRAS
eukprot:6185746-Amphidinium_carterae.1